MVANQNVSLTNYDAKLIDAQRRQKLAEMLQTQANAPIDIQSYKGVQAPIPWTAVLAKALQSGVAGYEGNKADELTKSYVSAKKEEQNNALNNLITSMGGGNTLVPTATGSAAPVPLAKALAATVPPAPTDIPVAAPPPNPMVAPPPVAAPPPGPMVAPSPVAAPSPISVPAPVGAPGGTVQNQPINAPVPQGAQPAPMVNPSSNRGDILRNIAAAQTAGLDTTDLVSAYNATKPKLTNVNGMMVDTENQANAGMFVPNLGEGQEPLYDKNGKIAGVRNLAGRVQSIADLEGAKAAAIEAAKAKQEIVTVNVNGIPTQMTRAQAAAQFGGQPSGPTGQGGAGNAPAGFGVGQSPGQIEAQKIDYTAGANLINNAATNIQSAKQTVNQMKQAIGFVRDLDPNKFTGASIQVAGVLRSLGINPPNIEKLVQSGEGFKILRTQYVLPMVKQLGTNPSNTDFKIVDRGFPGVTTPKDVSLINFSTTAASKNKEAAYNSFAQNYPGNPSKREIDVAWNKTPESKRSIFQDPIFQSFQLSNGKPAVLMVKKDGKMYGFVNPYNVDGSRNKNADVFEAF
jgi:hypothetical protein